MQLVGVSGSFGMRGGLHLLCQVARAVQRVRGGPLEKSLLTIKEDQLQGQIGVGALHGGIRKETPVTLLLFLKLHCHLQVLRLHQHSLH